MAGAGSCASVDGTQWNSAAGTVVNSTKHLRNACCSCNDEHGTGSATPGVCCKRLCAPHYPCNVAPVSTVSKTAQHLMPPQQTPAPPAHDEKALVSARFSPHCTLSSDKNDHPPPQTINKRLTTVDQCFNTSCVTPSPFLSHSTLSFLFPSTPTPTPDNWTNTRMHLQHHTISLYSLRCTPRAPPPCAPS
jgi:hypothetical protein